ncbi:MAG: hypothetical protein HQM11_05910 [SAR324 cluster bacterium]|nr:hypothetical protein [SAR324 cluster bacterium]
MRSISFQRPVKFELETVQETWNQGDKVNGNLIVQNMDDKPVTIKAPQIVLAHGLYKEIKAHSNSWGIIGQQILDSELTMLPGEHKVFEWECLLETHCPISDNAGSLFLLFGDETARESGGKINLNVGLHPLLQGFLQTFETQFHFLKKYEKNKKDWLEIKLVPPPSSKDFPTLDHLMCLLRLKETNIEIEYNFKVKLIGREGENIKMKQKTRQSTQVIAESEYLQAGGFPNRACFRQKIEDALELGKPGSLF